MVEPNPRTESLEVAQPRAPSMPSLPADGATDEGGAACLRIFLRELVR